MGIEQANYQQMAVAANLAAMQELNQLAPAEFERQLDTDNSGKVEESLVKQALGDKKGKFGTNLLAKLASSLAQTMPTGDILENVENYKFVDEQEAPSHDFVQMRSDIEKKQAQQKEQQLFSGADKDNPPAQKPKADIKEYVGAYSQMLVNGGSETRKKIEQLESRLISEKGVSPKEIQNLKIQVATSVRQEVLKQIKNSFIQKSLENPKSLAGLMAKRQVSNFIDYAFNNDNLGGYDFGGVEGHLQGAVNRAREESKQELKDFVGDALTDISLKKALGQESREIEKELDQLLKLGQKVDFDLAAFLNKLPQLKADQGMDLILTTEYVPHESSANNNGNNNQQQPRHNYQYTTAEEQEILTDKLRAIYLRRALYADVRTIVETQFKMIKTQNGLIRLGLKNFDQIEKEGQALAKVNLFAMLKEAFEERATYAKLEGPAWQMTEKKIKTVLRNLEKLGISLSQMELDQLRDKANRRMHAEAEHELSLICAAIDVQGETAYFMSKRKTVESILSRIAQESGLQAPVNSLKFTMHEAC